MTVRKRLRLLPLVIALVAGLLGATAPLTQAVQPAIVIGTNSCQGSFACDGATGPIGDNSCNGYFACYFSQDAIGDNSCNGEEGSCESASASVGDNSCNGSFVCLELFSPVGNCVNNDVQPAACETQPDARIRRVGRHNLVGNSIYSTDATDQTLTATLTESRPKARFSITIQNDADVADSFTLAECNAPLNSANVGPAALVAVKFLTGRPGQDITNDVLAGTYETSSVPPGGKFRLRAVVKAEAFAPWLVSCLVTATSVGNPANADAVRFIVNFEATPG